MRALNFAAAAQFPASRYWNLLAELVFFYVMMIAYVLLWDRIKNRRVWLGLLATLAATDLLYHFPPLMAMIALIPTRSDLIGVDIDLSVYRRLMIDPEIVARTLHIWLASLAMTGAALMLYGLRALRVAESQADGVLMTGTLRQSRFKSTVPGGAAQEDGVAGLDTPVSYSSSTPGSFPALIRSPKVGLSESSESDFMAATVSSAF